MKPSSWGLALALGVASAAAWAQAGAASGNSTVYRCPGPPVLYTDALTAKEAKEKLQLDLFYIKHLSVLLDAAIILETFKVVVLGRGAK